MTPDEIQQRIEELRSQFFANEIDAVSFEKQLRELEQQKLQVQSAVQQDPLLGVQLQRDFEQREQPKQVIQVPSRREFIPPKYGPESQSAAYEAQQKFVGNKTRYYMDELGFDQEEAVQKAIDDANKTIKPPTPKYEPLSNLFLSDIVDAELGIVRNKDGTLRKAGSFELAFESLFRQPIGAAPSVKRTIAEEALRIKQDEERRKKLPSTLTFKEDLERKTKEVATGAARNLFTETQLDKGLIYESGLAAGLRSGTMIPSAGAAAIISQGIDPKETEEYRKADSAEFVDQVIVNIAKGQGLPQVAMATFPEHKNTAFAVGLIPELFLPLTGIPLAVGTLAKGARVVAKGTAKLGVPIAPNVLYSASAPIEAIKRSTTAAQVDLLFDQLNTGKTSKQVLDQAYKDMSWEAVLNKEIPRQTLRGVAAKELADRGAGLSMLDSILKTDVPVTAGELRALNNTTIAGFVTELDDATTVTRSNLGVDLAKELDQWSKVVAGNKDWTRIYNQNRAAKQTVEEILKAQKFNRPLERARTTVLVRPFLDELNRSRVTKLVEDLSPEDAKPILGIELAEEVDNVLTKTNDLDLKTITSAFERTLEKAYNENLLNLVPEDLIVLTKGIVVPTKQFKNTKVRDKYFRDLKSELDKLTVKEDTIQVAKGFENQLIKTVIDYAGVATVRDSKMYQDFIRQTIEGSFDTDYLDLFVRPAIIQKVAGENFNVRRLQTAGQQFEEARVPLELRGDVLAISEGQDFTQQLQKGSVGKTIKTLETFIDSIKSYYKSQPTLAPQVGYKIAPEFVTLEKQINQRVDKIMDGFTSDLKKELKDGKSLEESFNKFLLEAYDEIILETKRRVETTATRAFQGNYKQYAEQFMPERLDLITANAELIAKRQGRAVNNQIFRLAVLDDATYLPKLDQWQSILGVVFGSTRFAEKVKNEAILNEFVRKGIGRQSVDPNLQFNFQSRASTLLDVTLTNINRVIERIENSTNLRRLKTPGLRIGKTQVVEGAETTLVVAQQYILGARQGQMVQKAVKEFLDTNPQYRQDLLPDYIGTNQQINLVPLTREYRNILEDLFLKYNKDLEIPDSLTNRLAQLHVQSLLSSIASQRSKINTRVSAVWGGKNVGQETLKPDLSTSARVLNDIIKPSIIPIQQEADKIITALNRRLGQKLTPDELQSIALDLKKEISELFQNGIKTDDVIFSNPIFSITEGILQQSKDFYRANGLAVGDDIISTLDENQLLFSQIRGLDSRLAYAAGENDTVGKMVSNLEQMSKSAKLRSTLEELQKVQTGEGSYIAYAFGQSMDMLRASLSQGLLAGTYIPNTRYLGQNIFTAPLIMMGTVGADRTAKSLRMLANGSFGKAKSIFYRNPEEVIFTSRSGRDYTTRELLQLEGEYNIGLSRNQIELYRSSVGKQMSDLGFNLQGEKQNVGLRFFNKFLNPTQRGIWSQFADATDMTYRRSVFYSALADDVPLEQAVDLAKRSLLDYGALSQVERNAMRRFVLFWSFTRQITSEFINAMAKGIAGGSHTFILKAARASMQQQAAAGSWLYGDDKLKSRMYSIWKGEIDNKDVWTFGFANPYVESFNALINIPFIVSGLINENFRSATEQIVQSLLQGSTPQMQVLYDFIRKDYKNNVRPDEIAVMKSMGLWPWFQQKFNVERIQKGKERATEPMFVDDRGNQVQYRMNDDGASSYAFYQLGSLLLGLNRPMKDFGKIKMAIDKQKEVDGQIEDYGRFALPNAVLYGIGAETSVPVKTENEIIKKAMNDLERAYRNK